MVDAASAVRTPAQIVYAEGLPESWISRRFGPWAVGAGLGLAIATFVIFAGFTPIIPTNYVVLGILGGDGVVVCVLLILIAIEIQKLRVARRAARAGSRLHTRLIVLFSLVAAIPATVTAVIATVSVEWAINPAFMRNVSAFINESGASSQLYRESQCQSLLRDADLTAGDLSRAAPLLKSNPDLYQTYFDERSKALGFTVAAVVTTEGETLITAGNSDRKLMAKPGARDFADATAKQPFCGMLADGNAFIALRPIAASPNAFFYAGRAIDPIADRVGRDAAQVTAAFANFEAHRRNIELGFAAVFIMLSLTLLISAVWTGLTFANRLVSPIRRLIRAADAVASGDFTMRVPTRKSEGDLAHLGETFNKMTNELRRQRESLVEANALNEERRAFIEAALAGVPAAVVGVDKHDAIVVYNAAAEKLLAPDGGLLMGQSAGEVFPALAPILADAAGSRARVHQSQATLSARGRERLLNVRVTGDPGRPDLGRVITLDDITDLVTAQRSSAWADVARRIAHEIKNPLTPIQLSAERLKRRYGRHIVEGKDIFDQCTDTIIRQVDDIKRMVDEFSNFARMPRARVVRDDLADCVRQALFLARVGRADLKFEDDLPNEPFMVDFDRRLVSQALTNILKNAGEGIDALGVVDLDGRIVVSLSADNEGRVRISVSDNGKGFPAQDRHKLTEPYVTTRAEGTGLGLPIVLKIFEDHHGGLELLDGLERPDGGHGAEVVMTLPLRTASPVTQAAS
jgi:two-component system, NtrC family, nitrogen regulation sensor histidine kinase NtrY